MKRTVRALRQQPVRRDRRRDIRSLHRHRDVVRSGPFEHRHVPHRALHERLRNRPPEPLPEIGLQRASINITGANLLLLTKYTGPDPEVNVNRGGVNGLVQGMDFGMPPQPLSLTLGLNITF